MLDWLEIVTRLGAAALVGGGVGLNRHLHHKAVGLRTLSLIAEEGAQVLYRGEVARLRPGAGLIVHLPGARFLSPAGL